MSRRTCRHKHILPLSSVAEGPASASVEDFLRDLLRDALGDRVFVKGDGGSGTKKIVVP